MSRDTSIRQSDLSFSATNNGSDPEVDQETCAYDLQDPEGDLGSRYQCRHARTCDECPDEQPNLHTKNRGDSLFETRQPRPLKNQHHRRTRYSCHQDDGDHERHKCVSRHSPSIAGHHLIGRAPTRRSFKAWWTSRRTRAGLCRSSLSATITFQPHAVSRRRRSSSCRCVPTCQSPSNSKPIRKAT